MDLWIRSQDKLLLAKAEFVLVNGLDIFNQNQLIGTYSTNERALEVLDGIQAIIRGKYTTTNFDYEKALNGFSKAEVQHMIEQMAVYEMPEE